MSSPAPGKIPVVLHHGFCGYRELKLGPLRIAYFKGIDRAIIRRGHPLIVPGVSPMGSVAKRAGQLKQIILEQLAAIDHPGPVVIVGHSMGGLDARYMISRLGMAERVAAVLTVCAPHRGSPYADWCVRHLGRRLRGFEFFRALGVDTDGAIDLTTERCARFNEETPDAPGVGYFSISGSRPWYRMPPFALHSHRIVAAAEGDNDGIVSVKSSTWADHLGCWPADHWHAMNKRYVVEFKNPTGDITPYYLRALDRVLARIHGEGDGFFAAAPEGEHRTSNIEHPTSK